MLAGNTDFASCGITWNLGAMHTESRPDTLCDINEKPHFLTILDK